MCGIVGLIAKEKTAGFSHKHRVIFEQMLYVNALRGPDSTGVFMVKGDGGVEWAKQASYPEPFLNATEGKQLLNKMGWQGVAMVGHNRKATFGTVKDENAHPFVEDKIILVHNGTLKNHKDLNKDVEVDSHAIASTINKHGVMKAISKIQGAFSVVAYNSETKELYIFRNEERPLFLGEIPGAWIFSSESWIAGGPCWREQHTITNMTEIAPGKLYTFKLDGNTMQQHIKDAKLFKEPPVKQTAFKPKQLPTIPQMKKKGGNDVIDAISRFRKDGIVCFVPERLLNTNTHQMKIVGWHYNNPKISVTAFVKGKYGELLTLSSADMLWGTIQSISADTTLNSISLYLSDAEESQPIVTISGETINEEQMTHISGKCHRCKNDIEEEELGASFYRERGDRHTHLCPTCVKDSLKTNPKWGGINKEFA